MPKYKVVEERKSVVEYEIEAKCEADAKILNGDIISEQEIENYGYDLRSCDKLNDE